MKNIAIITARSGSKGLKDKNIKELCGKPLIAYTIEEAVKSRCFDTVMVSTDSELYASIAIKYGAEVPFLRSPETSSDAAGSWEVVDEVLCEYQKRGFRYDTLCLLQPTSPLRKAKDIEEGYKLLEEKSADAITAVCRAEHSMGVYLKIPADGSLMEFRKEKGFYLPRQKQDELYRINGALYIRKIVYHSNAIETLSKCEFAFIMSKENSIDIDDEMDFKIAETLMNVCR